MCVAVSSLRTITVVPGDTVSEDGVNAKFLMTTVTELAVAEAAAELDAAEEDAGEVDAGAGCELPQAASTPAAMHSTAK